MTQTGTLKLCSLPTSLNISGGCGEALWRSTRKTFPRTGLFAWRRPLPTWSSWAADTHKTPWIRSVQEAMFEILEKALFVLF